MQLVKLAFTVFLEENCTFILHFQQPKFELHYVESELFKFQKRCANVFLSLYLIE